VKISEEIQVPLSTPEALRKFLYDTLRLIARTLNKKVSITNGYADTSELGSGTASATTYLRGDNTWATPAGGGSATFGFTTVDFGATPVAEATFTVTDAGVTSASYVECFVQGDSTADNDADSHLAAGRSFRLTATPASGSFSLDVQCVIGLCTGEFKLRYSYA
jgi:hypothetical protein